MNKKKQLHRILEFVCIQNNRLRITEFSSREIANAFEPKMKIPDVNALFRIIIDKGDLADVTTNEQSLKDTMSVLINDKTHEAFLFRKYLKWTKGEISLGIVIVFMVSGIITGLITGIIKITDIINVVDFILDFIK